MKNRKLHNMRQIVAESGTAENRCGVLMLRTVTTFGNSYRLSSEKSPRLPGLGFPKNMKLTANSIIGCNSRNSVLQL